MKQNFIDWLDSYLSSFFDNENLGGVQIVLEGIGDDAGGLDDDDDDEEEEDDRK